MNPPLITIRGLRKTYRWNEALRGIDLEIPEGRVTAFLGPNGAGKTTAIKCALNLIPRSGGEISVMGKDPQKFTPEDWRKIGYASENQPYPKEMNLRQWLDYLRPMYGSLWDTTLEKRLLADFHIPPEVPLKSLSRGQRMKALLLGSLAYRPRLVVLDEPFAGLDPLARDEILSGLLELSEADNWTVWISSHDIEEIQRFADRAIFLKDGIVELQEDVEPLLARHRQVIVTFEEPPALPAQFPATWRQPTASGRTFRFIDTAYDEAQCRAAAEAVLPPFARLEAQPIALREIFVSHAKASPAAETLSPAAIP